MTTHKAIQNTESGTTTTWIVKDSGYLTFRVILFVMGEEYSYKSNKGNQIVDLSVEAFDHESFEWKGIVSCNDFSQEEVRKFVEEDSVLEEVNNHLNTFYGISMYRKQDTSSEDELPF